MMLDILFGVIKFLGCNGIGGKLCIYLGCLVNVWIIVFGLIIGVLIE